MTPMGPFINEMMDLTEPKHEGLRAGANRGRPTQRRGEERGQTTPPARCEPRRLRVPARKADPLPHPSPIEQDHERALILPVRRVVHSDVETAPECTTHPTPPL